MNLSLLTNSLLARVLFFLAMPLIDTILVSSNFQCHADASPSISFVEFVQPASKFSLCTCQRAVKFEPPFSVPTDTQVVCLNDAGNVFIIKSEQITIISFQTESPLSLRILELDPNVCIIGSAGGFHRLIFLQNSRNHLYH
jgi:hypothetical protein